jgi:hypothetical protein
VIAATPGETKKMSASVKATANVVGTSNGQGGFNYTVTLNDTGSTTIGTFWFSWVPGASYMTAIPSAIGFPTGWTDSIVPESGGYSIEWTAKTSASYIQAGGSSSAFTFTSSETPAQLAANSTLAPTVPTTTAFVYSGPALASSSDQFVASVTLPPVEAASATMTSLETSPGLFHYTISLTDTGNTPVHTFWFAWDDVPDQDFMSQSPTNIGSPSGWTPTVTSHVYSDGTGYGILWEDGSTAADLQPTNTVSTFSFDSTETPAQFAADQQFNDPSFHTDFLTTSSFVYSGEPEQTPGGNFVVEVACFREGTRVRTPSGDVVIEAVRPGDLVLTEAGETRPVLWTGHRRVDCRRHGHPGRVWPVRVAAGALAPSVPAADLYLSPDHALFLDGVLVPVKYLVTTIAFEPTDTVIWHHLELETHDVILAEGAAAETYLDTGDRAKFDGQITRLFPGGSVPGRMQVVREAASDMDLVVSGPILAAIRRRVAERAWLLSRNLMNEDAA